MDLDSHAVPLRIIHLNNGMLEVMKIDVIDRRSGAERRILELGSTVVCMHR